MINLLPPARLTDLRIAHSNTVFRRYIELTAIAMVILGVVLGGAYTLLKSQQQDTQRTLDLSQQKIQKLEPVQKQAEQLSLTVNTIAGLSSRSVKFSDMLTQITKVLPQGSVLKGLQFSIEDLKSPLVISADVTDDQKAAVLRNNLASSPLFSKVEIQSIVENDTSATASDGSQQASSYKYTATLNAYLKPQKGVKQ